MPSRISQTHPGSAAIVVHHWACLGRDIAADRRPWHQLGIAGPTVDEYGHAVSTDRHADHGRLRWRSDDASQNTTDEKRTDPQQSEHSDATANPESDTTQSPHMQTDGSDAGASTHGLINLNTATAEELQSIKGIGPVTAQRIIDHRTAIGGYTSVDQLLDVKGIGSKTLETMRGQVTVG